MHDHTKMKFIGLNFALIFLVNVSFGQKGSGSSHLKSEIDFGSGTVISTFLDLAITQDQFTITSPKNADIRIMGGGKARLGRLAGKLPKKGRIITIKGEQKKDSLFGNTVIPAFGKLKFIGKFEKEILSGELLNYDGAHVGTLSGVRSAEYSISYRGLYPQLLKTIQDNIYSKNVLQTEGWRSFEKGLKRLCHVAHDDIELYFGFSLLTPKLPFTHLNLLIAHLLLLNPRKL